MAESKNPGRLSPVPNMTKSQSKDSNLNELASSVAHISVAGHKDVKSSDHRPMASGTSSLVQENHVAEAKHHSSDCELRNSKSAAKSEAAEEQCSSSATASSTAIATGSTTTTTTTTSMTSSASSSASSSSASVPKTILIEKIQDEKVDAEFEELMRKPNSGEIVVNKRDPRALKILEGFKIVSMNMRDGGTGEMMWESKDWGDDVFENEKKENIPKAILSCRSVSREINFSSVEELKKFRIEQRVFFQGQCIEEWFFTFGFVIPGSTNSWQQVISAAPPDEMLPPEVLSGHVTIETSFFDDKLFIGKNLVRIFYT